MELTVADVDGPHLGGAALQQAVAEPAGRCAGIETAQALDPDAEVVERGLELEPTPPHVTRRRAEDHHGLARSDQTPGLVCGRAADGHPTGGHQLLGLTARRYEATPDQLEVEPAPR